MIDLLKFRKSEAGAMKDRKVFSFAAWTVVFVLSIANAPVQGAEYPTGPITLINTNAPGGFVDIIGRAYASEAEKHLGKPVVMVHKPGAAGLLGGTLAAKAPPDGYTILLFNNSITCAIEWEIAEGRQPPFTRNDFIPIGSLVMSPTIVVVPEDSPWKTLADLIKEVKAKSGHYAFCSGGLHGNTHVAAELLLKAIGAKARHVPYQGGGPCLAAIVGKHIDFASQFPPTSIPLIRGKKLRALAVQSSRRLKSLPEVPTVKEFGIDAEFYNWVGPLVPQKTPASIVAKLREITEKVIKEKQFVTAIETPGDEVRYMNGDEVAKYWAEESEMAAKMYEQMRKEEGTSPK
jgi:tripartite-type tricarboxylate transporter receptor subunit TctC